jgi:hypothetical protein
MRKKKVMTRAKLALASCLAAFVLAAVALLAPASSAGSTVAQPGPTVAAAACTPAWGSVVPAICI